MRKSKYGNKRTIVDGISFSSKREAKRYCELKLLEKCGKISNLRCQARYPLVVKGVKICTYVADFVYHDILTSDIGIRVVEDVKGVKTPAYKLKKKLMLAVYSIEIVEV